jgi:hypothetical protein
VTSPLHGEHAGKAKIMLRDVASGLVLLWSIAVTTISANAQPLACVGTPRAWCVTDPYGTPFSSWYGSPVAFNSYFYMSANGGSSTGFGYSTTTNGFYLGGVPAVASATTPEWIVQRTSVFPIGSYYPWANGLGPIRTPWIPQIGRKSSTPNSIPLANREKSAAPAGETHILQVSDSVTTEVDRVQEALAEGDRLLRQGQHAQAYLSYLHAQREVGDRGEVYFRQAFALIAMGRFSHAVAKLKRGLQVDPNSLHHTAQFEKTLGTTNEGRAASYLQQVEQWAEAVPSDPDRLLLLGFLLRCIENPPSR